MNGDLVSGEAELSESGGVLGVAGEGSGELGEVLLIVILDGVDGSECGSKSKGVHLFKF